MSKYRVTSKYGWRNHPITNKRRFHAGVDLVKGHKQAIPAFESGEVIYSGLGISGSGLGGYGNVVFIKNKQGLGFLYAHLDSVRVRTGNHVKKGQVIGTQGATGNVTGSHLHFEVRKKTSPQFGWTNRPEQSTVNPMKYVPNSNKGGKDRVVKKIKEDGDLGPKTIDRLQQFFGTPRDGKLSKPSVVIKALQKFLNNNGQ